MGRPVALESYFRAGSLAGSKEVETVYFVLLVLLLPVQILIEILKLNK